MRRRDEIGEALAWERYRAQRMTEKLNEQEERLEAMERQVDVERERADLAADVADLADTLRWQRLEAVRWRLAGLVAAGAWMAGVAWGDMYAQDGLWLFTALEYGFAALHVWGVVLNWRWVRDGGPRPGWFL